MLRLAYYNAINEYTVLDEMPTGKGFADIGFLPRPFSDKPAMLIELKFNQSAKGAIDQIKKKKYIRKLEAYHGDLLLVGINYDKDKGDKAHTCVIERLPSGSF